MTQRAATQQLAISNRWVRKLVVRIEEEVEAAVPGQELFSPPAADYFLTLIDGAQSWVGNLATKPDAERFEKILEAPSLSATADVTFGGGIREPGWSVDCGFKRSRVARRPGVHRQSALWERRGG